MNVLDLFSGIGGFSLGLERAGMRTVAFCETDPFCREVLKKHWPEVPIFEDVRKLRHDIYVGSDGRRRVWDGDLHCPAPIDVICGGFPCQDISYAGPGHGLAGDRSGLWFQYARIIGEMGPKVALVENVAALLDRGMRDVLGTLADLRYHAEWDTVSACSVGHSHVRKRVFLVAYSDRFNGRERLRHSLARAFRTLQAGDGLSRARARHGTRLENPSALYGGADGVPFGMDRNHAIGNSIVPAIAETIGQAIMSSALPEG